jgi:UDP-GlcNAc3NAcA epimerase
MKIITVVGARPQFIKAALVSAEFKEKKIEEVIVHTGQHYDENMSGIFFEQMGIQHPKYNLEIKANTHASMTGRMMEKIEEVLLLENPDMLLVYGDTNSTLAAALAARKLNIPIAHVEAGLRNFDFRIPEDVNRTLTDRISDILFCPTDTAVTNLLNEGFANFPCRIVKTDDIMADSVKIYSELIDKNPSSVSDIIREFIKPAYLLCTVHRQESTTVKALPEIVSALNKISSDFQIMFPIHPRTKKLIAELGLSFSENVKVIEPVGYLEMQYLLKSSSGVITDSGGLQKEAYLHGKYSLLLMDFTPWVELVESNVSVPTKIDFNSIMSNYKQFSKLNGRFDQYLYGKGEARIQIVENLMTYLNQN